ncbi:hypothetical protein SEA_SURVIVORS_44 [Gordonia phage Survivors]|uniref:Uncharacterized protein n=1 Tax=Gordonia phage Azira TaxID=3035369 RepID=A0AAF0GH72_9CAUD|nr:hypothetical protein QLQ73_gp44 [Gordonia phage Azira]UVK59617.1 hypothetical protein SEA_SURVIVORS_44 [Gordonia phage Survivors]WGH21050.1 hypothetical protein SEA_AZIRA_44 [Gordonia phage Azira]WNM75493.1 hypothetical protein SEA_NIBBLES_43 [Gordonia phage Nibbles]
MRVIKAPTMHEAHDALANRLLYSHIEKFEIRRNLGIFHHVYLQAESMTFDYDLKRVWVPPSRWTMMIRQYLDPDDVLAWLNLIRDRRANQRNKRGDRMVLRTNTVASQGAKAGKGKTRNLGSCMLSVSVGFEPYPEIMLHSRTCYVGYLSPLDMAVAYHLGRLAAQANAEASGVDIPLEAFKFTWFLETAQYHDFRTIAFPLGDDEAREVFDSRKSLGVKESRPALWWNHRHRDQWDQENADGVPYSERRGFQSYKRLVKRYNTELYGVEFGRSFDDDKDHGFDPLPSTPVNTLDLSKIGVE